MVWTFAEWGQVHLNVTFKEKQSETCIFFTFSPAFFWSKNLYAQACVTYKTVMGFWPKFGFGCTAIPSGNSGHNRSRRGTCEMISSSEQRYQTVHR